MNDALERAVHSKIVEIAGAIGNDASGLGREQNIPGSGLLDSAGLLELVAWIETEHGLTIPNEDLTVENLGTIEGIARYVERARLRQ